MLPNYLKDLEQVLMGPPEAGQPDKFTVEYFWNWIDAVHNMSKTRARSYKLIPFTRMSTPNANNTVRKHNKAESFLMKCVLFINHNIIVEQHHSNSLANVKQLIWKDFPSFAVLPTNSNDILDCTDLNADFGQFNPCMRDHITMSSESWDNRWNDLRKFHVTMYCEKPASFRSEGRINAVGRHTLYADALLHNIIAIYVFGAWTVEADRYKFRIYHALSRNKSKHLTCVNTDHDFSKKWKYSYVERAYRHPEKSMCRLTANTAVEMLHKILMNKNDGNRRQPDYRMDPNARNYMNDQDFLNLQNSRIRVERNHQEVTLSDAWQMKIKGMFATYQEKYIRLIQRFGEALQFIIKNESITRNPISAGLVVSETAQDNLNEEPVIKPKPQQQKKQKKQKVQTVGSKSPSNNFNSVIKSMGDESNSLIFNDASSEKIHLMCMKPPNEREPYTIQKGSVSEYKKRIHNEKLILHLYTIEAVVKLIHKTNPSMKTAIAILEQLKTWYENNTDVPGIPKGEAKTLRAGIMNATRTADYSAFIRDMFALLQKIESDETDHHARTVKMQRFLCNCLHDGYKYIFRKHTMDKPSKREQLF